MRHNTIALLISAGLAGCAVGPDYKETAPIVPDNWQAAKLSEAQKMDERGRAKAASKPVDSEALKHWWKSFGDAELDRLMDQALAGNLDVKIALTRVDQ
ncbi:MAG: TolC family protein, partial [Methylococcaceae bacterium]|nr:TolC family protein [Methylococcaceae bacterium]